MPTLAICSSIALRPAFAQTQTSLESPVISSAVSTPAAVAPTALAPTATPPVLSIALPPQARLRLDVDARDAELLGVVKSLLQGFEGSGLNSVVDSFNKPVASPTTVAGPTDITALAALKMLSNADLSTFLQGVHHLRVVAFETPSRPGPAKTAIAPPSIIAYYEDKYVNGEGAHRTMRADFDDIQMMIVSFPEKGFAAIFQAPGMGIVVRSDGYPNLSSIGPLVTAFLIRTSPSPRY